MQLSINGQVNIGTAKFWRIDDLEEQRVGLDMLQNPWALVRDLDAAEKIVAALKAQP